MVGALLEQPMINNNKPQSATLRGFVGHIDMMLLNPFRNSGRWIEPVLHVMVMKKWPVA